ncbi:sugar ABC transporter permease [Acetivibrio sp. MSJd-27]|uniref:ABC transporter permease n=1 Tax=Acetivibrio sp. MSJd-27 TaxID=2841523 RepID=UPI001C12968F|nr:ABC transporter permease subunit [Acetivibrio sp. MSJd-27]MBU5450458.1 ABC transporter permease subunit [Acetivibrio sp. MSJd-27]
MAKASKADVSTTVTVRKRTLGERLKKDWQLILLALPGVVFYIIFRYGPMYGLTIAFKDYGIYTGILGSPWIGFKNFVEFFNIQNGWTGFASSDFLPLFRNTLLLGLYSLFWGFPFPILFAILLNEVKNSKFKKLVQTTSFLPSFLSVVVVCSMLVDMLSPSNGAINSLLKAIGLVGEDGYYFMIKPEWFRTIYIASDIWQNCGYNAIIYVAALAGVDQQLYEAAKIDGCGRIKSMWYVTLPSILPTVATMFIMRSGNLIKIGYEKVILLYQPATYSVADIFGTFVYRKGIIDMDYSYSTAVGLFESTVALILVITCNTISRKLTETSLW